MNTFRSADAFEFVDAARWGVGKSADEIKQRLVALHQRLDAIEAKGEPLPSYLLAALRGYESAHCVALGALPFMTVKLDETL